MANELKTGSELEEMGLIPVGKGEGFVSRNLDLDNPRSQVWQLVNPGSIHPLYENLLFGSKFYREFYKASRHIERPFDLSAEVDKKMKALEAGNVKSLRTGRGDSFISLEEASPQRIAKVFIYYYDRLR